MGVSKRKFVGFALGVLGPIALLTPPPAARATSTAETGISFGPGDYSRFNPTVRDPGVRRNYCLRSEERRVGKECRL